MALESDVSLLRNLRDSNYSFIAFTRFADCPAMINTRVSKNTAKKVYLVTVEQKYGGCRSLTPHTDSFLLEKIPSDYSVQFENLKSGY